MKKSNGWKKIAFAATTIVAVAAAMAVLEPYVKMPWSPPITFVWASENILARLDNQLFSYTELLQQAIQRKDQKAIRRQTKNVTDTRRKIKEIEAVIKREKQ